MSSCLFSFCLQQLSKTKVGHVLCIVAAPSHATLIVGQDCTIACNGFILYLSFDKHFVSVFDPMISISSVSDHYLVSSVFDHWYVVFDRNFTII